MNQRFFVDYRSDEGEIFSFPIPHLAGGMSELFVAACGILYMNDLCPGNDWRIRDDGGETVNKYDFGANEMASYAFSFYDRKGVWGEEDLCASHFGLNWLD